MMQDEYQTIAGVAEQHLTVKKSRFIGLATSVRSREEFADFMEYARESYPAASHYCYASTIGYPPGQEERSGDAGEPTHSAGPPILSAVKATELTNIACIVVRYFGGIKLGIGGLIRAYGKCARGCLASAKRHTQIFTEDLRVRTPYNGIGNVIQWVERAQGQILDIQYDQDATISLRLRLSRIPDFLGEMQGTLPGFEVIEELICPP